ncbi:cytosol aminopeptidase [Nematocida homosporus]|uniref:cytosol aminopeptidase n=1 Tax=Nematocida homosporus TaxID=1912981 RepID=UPI0022208788|nr:cytosol aminopeptidase [Nematocida homosporus]KAI5184559.1 cytosol aminopeptidase [Nematocida homosporus]
MNWKRVCCREKKEAVTGLTGEIVICALGEAWPEKLGSLAANLPESEGARFILFGENQKVFGVCRMSKEDLESLDAVRSTAAKLTNALMKEEVASILISDGPRADWIAEAVVVASYQYDPLLSKKKSQVQIVYLGNDEKVGQAIVVGEAQNFARFLVDTPANLMTPTRFTEYAREYLPESVSVKVYNKEEIQKMNMNLFLGVAQGSMEEPKFLEMKYNPGNECTVLVGKGITFDSGGISLKPALKMGLMKGDMGGGAAVVSSIGALARLGAKTSVVGLVPLTENLPSGTATKPGDVHVGRAGISVEVDNTDAEGRLILADALHYAQSFSPKRIIDLATLTGAINIALGPIQAGLFTTCDQLANEFLTVSNEVGDLVWRMPMNPIYRKIITSEVADLKNISNSVATGGQSTIAAMFLKEFVGSIPWAHLDIAAVAHATIAPELHGKGATGRPVKLLVNWLLRQ